jgi:signal transduction histidine kinase
VFASVTAEVGRVLGADITVLGRFDPDGEITAVGVWSSAGSLPVAVGSTERSVGRNVGTLVRRTGRPARIDDYADTSGQVGELPPGAAIRWSVGVPVTVEGRLWGVMVAESREEPLSADTEARLAGFTELVATAIANAEAQAALAASRARIVVATDAARQRIESELHEGVLQRLVSLAGQIRATRAAVPPAADALTAELDGVSAEIGGVLDELREIARGLHPSALADGGLRPALKTLARRSAVPVHLDVRVDGRLPDQIELAAYYVIAEALTNAAKHADAAEAQVQVEIGDGRVRVCVRDDGRGGAELIGGSGLVGLTDRVEALGGQLELHSAPGAGTAVRVVLPLSAVGSPGAGEPVASAPPAGRPAP